MVLNSSKTPYIILAIGFIIRLWYVWFVHPVGNAIYSDMNNYVFISDLISHGEWRPTHFFQPIGFPLILVFLKKLTTDWMKWLGVLQAIASSLSLYFIWKLTDVSYGRKIGIWTLILTSVHLPWIAFSGFALAETFFIFFLSLLAWATYQVIQKNDVLSGVFWGFSFLFAFFLKGTHIFYGPLFVGGLFLWKKQSALKPLISISLIVGLGLISHGLFTQAKIGKFQLSASAGGLNFVEGKCPEKNNADSAGYSWLSPLYFQMGKTKQKRWDQPFTDSGYFMKEGAKCIGRDPLVLIKSLEGIPYLFIGNTLWPANQLRWAESIRVYELFFAIFFIVGIVVFFRFLFSNKEWKEELLIWGMPIMSLFLCVYIFKSEIRFRIPFDVWIIPVSIRGWFLLMSTQLNGYQPHTTNQS